MAAHFISMGEPAHDAERQAIRFLVEGLPTDYTVFGNAWLVERSGVVYELDAVVAAPHAIYVVEIKSYRGRIEGTDHTWYIPEPVPSPIKRNRKTAQVLKEQLKRRSYQAGQVWVQGLVFLSATTNVGVKGPASRDRIHTRKTILAALQDPGLVERLSGRQSLVPTESAQSDLLYVLTGTRSRGPRPLRRVREYDIVDTLDHHDTYTELVGRHRVSDAERLLRIYSIPPLASEDKRQQVERRARWEAQVLGRLGRIPGILSADPPFIDEAGLVLPLEHFRGIALPTWLERFGPAARTSRKAGRNADLRVRTDLWMGIARAIDDAHRQGVVHRLLRPEIILVQDAPDPDEIRVIGFDLAKQLGADTTVHWTSLADERLVFAAPEVISAFSSAEPASDQFSLGAILALLLTGKPLFASTRELMAARRLMRRVRDSARTIPLHLDEAVSKMVAMRPTDRFPSLHEAIEAVRLGRDPGTRALDLLPPTQAELDPDNLEPRTRIEPDYEIQARLGQGGMGVVYAARHLASGRIRALKIARCDNAAEEALRGEHRILDQLDHPNVVRVRDLTHMVKGRLTLVMERVGGQTLRQWLAENQNPDPHTQRQLAENLLSGLEYLENQGVTHKDLKPDNLLVGDGRLTIIDFSLAAMPEDAPYGGTALYRDPASSRWTHATDRYAAALCLFELYAGRHPFDGTVPEPGQGPAVAEDDIDPPGLAAFFRKALHPTPEQRFPSARAMRDALLAALGVDVDVPGAVVKAAASAAAGDAAGALATAASAAANVDLTTPLRLTGLSRRAVNALARSQVATVADLLALPASQVQGIHAIGTKTAADILSFQDALRARGLSPAAAPDRRMEPPLVADLVDSPEPLERLPLSPSVRTTLETRQLRTVGALASQPQAELLALPGIGRSRLSRVVEALHQFRDHTPDANGGDGARGAHTLDRFWELASRPLTDDERIAVERCVGILSQPEPQADIADDLRKRPAQVSADFTRGLDRLDVAALADPLVAVDSALDGFDGVVRLDELGQRFAEVWPAGMVSGAGMIRLLVRISSGRAHLVEVDGVDVPVCAVPAFDRDTLRAFTAEVERLAKQWPPVEPDTSRRTLAGLLPHFAGDPLSLGYRLCDDVEITAAGHLFMPPIDAPLSIGFVLEQARDPVPLDDLQRQVRRMFGPETPYPDRDHLMQLLRDLDCRVQGDAVIPGHSASVVAAPAMPRDPVAKALGAERSPHEAVRDMLLDAAGSRGFRILVTPPEHHADIGPSVARALGGTWVSFADAFFRDHGANIAALERAERFVAQRDALTEAAEDTMFRLLDEHGRPDHTAVVGDTGLLGVCDALDLPRRLYDETLSGSRGFWVLVVPGVIYKSQPHFNEGPSMWQLAGATFSLLTALPDGPGAPTD
ncbi:MAG: protein kinase [Proteobacteria bacterium]|nr:protein kinase [Pseudomonadota bacterium]